MRGEQALTTATVTELWRLSATELAKAIKTKLASSREVIEAHLRRIEAVNPSLNAVVIVMGEEAIPARLDHWVRADPTWPGSTPHHPSRTIPHGVRTFADGNERPGMSGAAAGVPVLRVGQFGRFVSRLSTKRP